MLQVTNNGRYSYVSLEKKLGSSAPQVADVDLVAHVKDRVQFVSQNIIYEADVRSNPIQMRYYKIEHAVAGAAKYANTLLLNLQGKGLHTFQDGQARPIQGGQALATDRLSFALQNKGQILIGGVNSGLYKLDQGQLSAIQAGGFLANSRLLTASAGQDGRFVVSTYSSGVAWMNANGQVIERFDQQNGLPSNEIFATFQDQEGGIWVGHSKGINVLQPQLPIRSFAHLPGLQGKITDVITYQGTPYLTTISGTYRLNRQAGRYERVANLSVGGWDLARVGDRLLVATTNGLFDISGGTRQQLFQGNNTNKVALAIHQSQASPDKLYVGTNAGVVVLQRQGGSWQDTGMIPDLGQEVSSIAEGHGYLWLGTNYQGLLRVKPTGGGYQIGRYEAAQGLAPYVAVKMAGGQPLFQTTERGALRYNPEAESFEPDPVFADFLTQKQQHFVPGPDGSIWFYGTGEVIHAYKQDGEYRFDSTTVANTVADRVSALYPGQEQVWLGFQDRLYRIQPGAAAEVQSPFQVLVRGVRHGQDSVFFGGNHLQADGSLVAQQGKGEALSLDYQQNKLQFNFAATSYLSARQNAYQYKLVGFDESWSAWTNEPSASYTNLPEGNYTFKVRGRNALGQVQEVASYRLRIAPPWFRTIYAYIGYGLGLIALVFGTVRLNARRLEAQKRYLEQQVEERTQEVRQRQEELKQERDKLEESNENLEKAYKELADTQEQLVQSEKMAALGQLIAGVAHEINTPIGAINGSVSNINQSLPDTLHQFPDVYAQLDEHSKQLFFDLINRSVQFGRSLSSREERKYRKELAQALEQYNIPDTTNVARGLVKIGLFENLEDFAPLFRNDNAAELIDMVSRIGRVYFNLNTIQTAVGKTQKIVFALKNYSRSKGTEDEAETVSLPDNIDTVLTLYHNQLKNNIEVETQFEDNMPYLECYPDQLNQVWTNIIHNAIQAMNNEGQLKIEAHTEGEQFVVKITDSGPGIPQDVKAKIFDPFFTTKPQGEGSGLGLDIVRKIVERHGGTIDVDSEPGRTTFIVTLPPRLPQQQEETHASVEA
jgi:signal transduction histidine kinase